MIVTNKRHKWTYSEIFKYVSEGKTRKDRADRLREFDTYEFRIFLKIMFNPSVKLFIDKVSYTKQECPEGLGYTTIAKRIPLLTGLTYTHVDDNTRNNIVMRFIELCECVSEGEAELLEDLLKRKYRHGKVSIAEVKLAYPEVMEG